MIDDILSKVKASDIKVIAFPPNMLIGLGSYLLNTIEVVGLQRVYASLLTCL